MCAFAVKTSAESPQTVADESATNDGVADKGVAGASIMPARRFRRPTVRQVKFVYFIVFGSRRRITFGAMDHAPAGKRKGARYQPLSTGLGNLDSEAVLRPSRVPPKMGGT